MIAIEFQKIDEERRLLYAPVFLPDQFDAQDDIVTPLEIEKAAHHFMMEYRHGKASLNDLHKKEVTDEQAYVVESYVIPEGNTIQLGEKNYTWGTWIIVVKVLDDGIWERVKTGELRGFSGGGTSKAYLVEAEESMVEAA